MQMEMRPFIVGPSNLVTDEQIYFPSMESSPSLEPVETSVPNEQIEIFKNLVELIASDSHFRLDLTNGQFDIAKDGLAFFVEAAKQLYKDKWKVQLNEVMQKIQNIRQTAEDPEQAYKSTTWLLNKLITNLYEISIKMKADRTHDQTEAKLFQMILGSINSQNIRCRVMEERNSSVALGGIHRSLLPQWYLKNFIFANEAPPKSLSGRSISQE